MMKRDFEELDFQNTPWGEISLRRRKLRSLDNREIYEVKLNEEFLMSSLFHDAEVALAKIGLAQLSDRNLDVVVGGLGLGYTAVSALKDKRVQSLFIVEALEPVISWHTQGLVPLGLELSKDPRTRFVLSDFFALTANPDLGFDPENRGRRFDAILLDIDHSPRHWLQGANSSFYSHHGLKKLSEHLRPGGAFALWSDDPVDEEFMSLLAEAFPRCSAHDVVFPNPLTLETSNNTVYVATI